MSDNELNSLLCSDIGEYVDNPFADDIPHVPDVEEIPKEEIDRIKKELDD